MIRIISFLCLVVLFASGCAPTMEINPGEPCPVTKSEVPGFLSDGGISPVAGAYPIWFFIPENSQILWDQLRGESLAPYPGQVNKQILVIADDFHGKISLSSKQIDGNGKVLFPNDNSWVRVSNSSGQYHEKPADTLIIDPSSSDHKIATPKPIGYTYYGYSLIYPNPGCYRFTASDGNGSIDMIIEVKN